MKNKKAFTLIELLAVIVILGLLMAIAIPSVTKYITQSRKKTLTNTIGNYMSALVNEVNDMVYTFTGTNTIYAVPIECIAVERGGTNPFGKWHQANNSYWAYVLVQYDDLTSSYKYGFTFKDSAGYGLYPTTQAKINEKGSQIVTGLNLNRPTNGVVTNITPLSNWTGFDVNSTTKLKVLTAGSEDQVGDGVNTCTLVQKGDNYAQVEEEKKDDIVAPPVVDDTIGKVIEEKDLGEVSWAQLVSDSNDGSYVTKYKVGNTLTLTMKDDSKIKFRIVGINHDKLANGTEEAPLSLVSVGQIEARAMNSTNTTSGGWKDSDIRNYLNTDFLNNMIPSSYVKDIKTVKKETVIFENNVYGTQYTDDKIWLLSFSEYGQTDDEISNYETGSYFYYLNKKPAVEPAIEGIWWLRSLVLNNIFFNQTSSGGFFYVLSNDEAGIVIGFCI